MIEAIQYTGSNINEIVDFVGDYLKGEFSETCGDVPLYDLIISTLEGEMYISLGDYIIKGVNGEFYPCKPDIFKKTYELVN